MWMEAENSKKFIYGSGENSVYTSSDFCVLELKIAEWVIVNQTPPHKPGLRIEIFGLPPAGQWFTKLLTPEPLDGDKYFLNTFH